MKKCLTVFIIRFIVAATMIFVWIKLEMVYLNQWIEVYMSSSTTYEIREQLGEKVVPVM